MSRKISLTVIDQMVCLVDHEVMTETLHRLSPEILKKIFIELQIFAESKTHEYIAEHCNTSPETITRFLNKKRGANPERFTLNMALKLWEGLGHPPETLIADCNVDPLLAERIKRIQESEWKELFDLLINVLGDAEYADPVELGEVKGDLKNLWRRIVKIKDQLPDNPGGKLSNLSKE